MSEVLANLYILESELASGAMGKVYRARHRLLGFPCAIKVLDAAGAPDPLRVERFRREGRHCKAHPNIVRVLDEGETSAGIPFFAMELIEGESLASMILKGPLPIGRVLSILIQIARALALSHDRGVIHRDLKPDNIRIAKHDHIKIVDFGIASFTREAKLTQSGEIFGTFQYMAPELATSTDASPSSDIYALGVIAYELLTQRAPFEVHDAASWLRSHAGDRNVRLRHQLPSAPQALDDLIANLIALDPNCRPVDAHEALRALEEIAREQHIAVPDLSDHESPSEATGSARITWEATLTALRRAVATPNNGLEQLEKAVHFSEHLIKHLTEAEHEFVSYQAERAALRDKESALRTSLSTHASAQSHLKRRLRDLGASLEKRSYERFSPQIRACHREILMWEGRSGFAQPSRELASHYKTMAALMDAWIEAHSVEAEAEQSRSTLESSMTDKRNQIAAVQSAWDDLDRTTKRVQTEHRSRMLHIAHSANEAWEALAILLANPSILPFRFAKAGQGIPG